LQSFPQNFEAPVEYLRFLKRQGNLKAASALAQTIVEKVDLETKVPTGLWVDVHIECAKIANENKDIEGAISLLMKLRHVLPPIDISQLDSFEMPFSLEALHERPLSVRAQVNFSNGLSIIDEDEERDEEMYKSSLDNKRKLSREAL
jgi:hypothetical protein